jgi:phage-related minor tail protein
MDVGTLVAYLKVDDQQFESTLSSADRAFESFAASMDTDLGALERQFDSSSGAMMTHLERSFAELDDAVEEAFRAAEQEAEQGARKIAQEVEQAVDKGLDGARDAARGQGGDVGEEFGAGIGDGGTRQAGGAAAGIAGALKAAPWIAAGVFIGEKILSGLTTAMENEVSGDLLAAQLDLTAAESAEMGKLAGGLYADAYGESMAEVNQAIGAVRSSIRGMAEASSSDLQGVTANAMDFAKAFGVDVAESATYAGTLLTDGLAKDADHAFDLMTAASQRVPASIRGDVLESAHEYGTFFKSLGFNGEQAFGLIVQAAQKGKFGVDKIGDAVKEFSFLATDMSTATKDAYKSIGLDALKMSNDILAGGDTAQTAYQKIVDGLQGIKDPTEQAASALALFGTPLEDLNKSDIPAFLDSMELVGAGLGDVTGKTDKLGETMADNASTKLEAFKRGMQQNVVEFLGGTVIPAVEGFVSRFDLSGIGAEYREVVGHVRAVAGEIVADVRTWVATHQAEIDKLVQGAQRVGDGISAAVSAAVDFVRPLWDLFGENILNVASNTFGSVLDIIGGGLDVLKGIFQVATGILTGDWSKVWEGLENIVQGTIDQVLGIIDLGIGNLVATLGGDWEQIKRDAQATWDKVVETVDRGVQWVKDAAAKLGELPGRFADWFGRAKDSAVGKLSELNDWVGGLPGRIVSAIGNLGSTLWSAGTDLINGLIRGIKDTAGRIAESVLGPIRDSVRDVKNLLGISSPSKVMAEIGFHMGEGLALGIEGTRGLVGNSLASLAEEAAGFGAQLTDGMRRSGSPQAPAQAADGTLGTPRLTPGLEGERALVNIENYHPPKGDDPHATAQELDWLSKAGG